MFFIFMMLLSLLAFPLLLYTLAYIVLIVIIPPAILCSSGRDDA